MQYVPSQFNSASAHRSPERGSGTKLKLSFAKLAAAQTAKEHLAAHPMGAGSLGAASRRPLYTAACDYLSRVFQAVRGRRPFALEPGADIIAEMASGASVSDELFITALHLDEPRQFALHHSVNVAVYAIYMAKNLGFDPERQVQIGLAGLLHDVGMALVPESIIYKQGALSESEHKALKERPNLAFNILQVLGPLGAAMAETASQIYERSDGSGYPRGLSGDEIHEFAQILGLLDLYEALVHSRPSRERLSFLEAVKYIFKSCKTQFERHYIKSLLRVFTVFPLHSCVELNSGAFGQVIETHPDQPMRPKLKVLMDSQHRKVLAERIIDLPEEPLLNVVRSVSEKESHELLQGTGGLTGEPEPGCDAVKEPIM